MLIRLISIVPGTGSIAALMNCFAILVVVGLTRKR
jgi:hypothetical protein